MRKPSGNAARTMTMSSIGASWDRGDRCAEPRRRGPAGTSGPPPDPRHAQARAGERVLALMPRRPPVGDDGAVTGSNRALAAAGVVDGAVTGSNRALAAAGVVAYCAAVVVLGVVAAGP